MNKLGLAVLFSATFSLSGQYQYQQLNHLTEIRQSNSFYWLNTEHHSSVRPQQIWRNHSSDTGQVYEVLVQKEDLKFGRKSWLGRKIFDEHLLEVGDENFDLTLDPIVNFQVGGSSQNANFNYINTRGISIEGRLGKNFGFQTSYLESQGRFPLYVSDFVNDREVVPGQGLARPFGQNGFDYGMASGQIAYSPDQFFTFSLGQGRHFFGEGYRSMFLSDAAFNYPFFKIETTFWKIKYVNLWAQLYDIRPAAQRSPDVFARKHLSSHYLSINLTKRWNLSFFEAVVLGDTAQQRGVDPAFFNPVIFYRPVEFASGFRAGNVSLGLATSYKIRFGFQFYGQILFDDFDVKKLLSRNGHWENMFSWQLGAQWRQAFDIQSLFLRAEYNAARPYTYSHRNALTNYGHYNQSLAHPWGSNFQEGILQAVWQPDRWEFSARCHYGIRGLDSDSSNFGTDIYKSYENRESETGNKIGQGLKGTFVFLEARAAWLVNPSSRLKLEAGIRYRSLDAQQNAELFTIGNTTQYFVGLRTELFNSYYDF